MADLEPQAARLASPFDSRRLELRRVLPFCTLMKQFSCGDVVPGCQAHFQSDSEEGLLRDVAAHAHADHGMTELSDELVATVKQHIRTANAH